MPDDVLLTSFSILMARYKGFLDAAAEGVCAISRLEDGDTVLISEGCTHHRQCDDIGTVKLPRWLREYTGKDIHIKTSSGTEFPEDLSPYKLQFIVLLIGGGIGAEVYMLYNILIAIRWGKCMLPVYSVTAVITIAVARTMVNQWGIMGASLNYLLSCSILFVLFASILIFVILRKKRQK